MQIEQSTVKKLRIVGAQVGAGWKLDPITVYIENYKPGQGKITIECFGDAWSSYWGPMGGDRNLEQFFTSCDCHYLASKLKLGIQSTINDEDGLSDYMRAEVMRQRRAGEISKDDAREMYDEAEYMDYQMIDHDLIQRVFGYEWWYQLPQKPNPEYEYLCRIIAAAQEGVKAALGSDMLKVAA
ncbi:hypothetical protein [Chitinimonas sp. BJB300]|uniref:hypothetical protein n=1 Tax=Chitinimonas sp. BJB300 TaxID=1559339 RepID=UPI001112C166|nr:hypothetical protein [Chitinimonas sp. BJB300]TSJ84602.1 hypothetical protein FG002_019395 [Chitinimonas sp. BJB300]